MHKLFTRIEGLLLCWGGYSPPALDHEAPEDRKLITKIGATVAFSAGFAVINWGLAGWTYSRAFEPGMRLAIAALAALIGALGVILLDRAFIFFLDTTMEGGAFNLPSTGLSALGSSS